jgi:hypothetical protein
MTIEQVLNLTDLTDREKNRFRKRIEVDPETGCWLFSGSTNGNGYVQVLYRGRKQQAHRLIFTLVNGPIPAGMHIDHVCRTRRCCRPDSSHLRVVTQAENNRASWEALSGDLSSCEGCGSQYTRHHPQQKYCSAQCQNKVNRALRKARQAEGGFRQTNQECRRCGETFLQKKSDHKFCSRSCKQASTGAKYIASAPAVPLPESLPCEWCGSEFKPSRVGHVLCSQKCNKARYRAAQKAKTATLWTPPTMYAEWISHPMRLGISSPAL